MIETRHMLACIGDHSRYLVIRTLAGGGQCVTEVARRIGRSQSCTTRHLQALARGGIVERERQGKRVVFTLRLDDPRVRGLVEWAFEHDTELAARPYLPAPNAHRTRHLTPVAPGPTRPEAPPASPTEASIAVKSGLQGGATAPGSQADGPVASTTSVLRGDSTTPDPAASPSPDGSKGTGARASPGGTQSAETGEPETVDEGTSGAATAGRPYEELEDFLL